MECKFVSRTKYRNKYSIFNILYIYPYILYALYALLHLQIARKYPQSGHKKKMAIRSLHFSFSRIIQQRNR